jgi:diaminohydroxyphosphoribosylaminopyrimidine deaminase/5-amino-6-(5-phosphoribosylamino)uracil reductase
LTLHETFMARALQLAKMGLGNVAPNPLVGCVIVHPEFGIIGEGYHQKYGGPHAEVHAIHAVTDTELLRKSSLYVTLEPCNHFGKTPPCADLVIKMGIPKVFVCNLDPNPLVAGKGIQKLKQAGIEVETGILEKEGLALNRFFFHFHTNKKPFITLKWAQTSDGFIARSDGSSKWISGPESRQVVHKWRAEHQAIWVGKNTLRIDNPSLTVRDWKGLNPIRIVLDPKLELPTDLQVFTDDSAPTWIFNQVLEKEEGHLKFFLLDPKKDVIESILSHLSSNNIQSLFVEGGSTLINSLIETGHWNEALVFTGAATFETGIPAPELKNAKLIQTKKTGMDLLQSFQPFGSKPSH